MNGAQAAGTFTTGRDNLNQGGTIDISFLIDHKLATDVETLLIVRLWYLGASKERFNRNTPLPNQKNESLDSD
jgi:hypothetical protein